jgi:hypothetical protein
LHLLALCSKKDIMLSKDQIIARRVPAEPVSLDLPDGESVWVVPVGSRLMRDYRRCLRDGDGKPIEDRKPFSDELLIARVLVHPDGTRMFSDQEVLDGMLTDLDSATWDALMEYAWSFITGGDRQKKSSPTTSTAAS